MCGVSLLGIPLLGKQTSAGGRSCTVSLDDLFQSILLHAFDTELLCDVMLGDFFYLGDGFYLENLYTDCGSREYNLVRLGTQ